MSWLSAYKIWGEVQYNGNIFKFGVGWMEGVGKICVLISNCAAAKILSFFSIILTKQQTLSVTRSFDSSLVLYYKRSIVIMRLSCTVMEIWRLKDNGVTSLTFWGHVTSSVTWPFDSRVSSSYGWSIVNALDRLRVRMHIILFAFKSWNCVRENFHWVVKSASFISHVILYWVVYML